MLKELYPNLPFDPSNDFTPIASIAGTAYVLVVHPELGVATLADLIALAKAKPGALSFASTGMGTAQHLSGELFKRLAGIDIVHVPYRGSGTVRADLMTGRVPMMFENLALMAPVLQRGELRGLAVTSAGAQRAGAGDPDHGGIRLAGRHHRGLVRPARAEGHAGARGRRPQRRGERGA